MIKDEAFFKDRILWMAQQHQISDGSPILVEHAGTTERVLLGRLSDHSMIGVPTLVFATQKREGTIVGTSGLAGLTDERWIEISYSDINEVAGKKVTSADGRVRKQETDTLLATTKVGEFEFRTAPGESLFSLWNIVRRLVAISGD